MRLNLVLETAHQGQADRTEFEKPRRHDIDMPCSGFQQLTADSVAPF
jgi:hypothetical protein